MWLALETKYINWLLEQDFSDILYLKGKLSNEMVRRWYKAHDLAIIDRIDMSQPLEQQARQAHALRNQYKTQARALMADRKLAASLDASERCKSFEEMMEHKLKKYGLTGEDAYRDIIRSAAPLVRALTNSLDWSEHSGTEARDR